MFISESGTFSGTQELFSDLRFLGTEEPVKSVCNYWVGVKNKP